MRNAPLLTALLSCMIASTALATGDPVDFASVEVRPKPGNNAGEKMTTDIRECAKEAAAGGSNYSGTTLFKYRSCLMNKGYQLGN